jgi:outer membrane protein assembly factor BamD
MTLNKDIKFYLFLATIFFSIGLINGCGSNRHRVRLDAEDQFAKAKEKLDRRKYRDAIDQFEIMINQNRGSQLIDDAHYYMGYAYYQIDDFIMAANEFDRLLTNYPASELADDALYMKAMCYFKQSYGFNYDQDLTLQAIRALQQYIDDFPLGAHIEEINERYADCINRLARKKFESGLMYFKRGNLYSAYLYLSSILTTYPSSDWVGPSLYFIGECYYKRKKYEDALQYFLQAQEVSDVIESRREAAEGESDKKDSDKSKADDLKWSEKTEKRLSELRRIVARGAATDLSNKENAGVSSAEPRVEP